MQKKKEYSDLGIFLHLILLFEIAAVSLFPAIYHYFSQENNDPFEMLFDLLMCTSSVIQMSWITFNCWLRLCLSSSFGMK